MVFSFNASYVDQLRPEADSGKKCVILSKNLLKHKKMRGMAQVIEYLPGKCMSLTSTPKPPNKKQTKKKKKQR
jgi:hypothetical protein